MVATTQISDTVIARYFPGSRRAHDHGRTHYGQEMSGAALATEFLKFVGARVVFGIPGGANLPLCDALTAGHDAGAFRYVLTGHEQGAGFEAEGYAAASGDCGFCVATSGPGATNLVTPLADATRDSRPVLALTGNVATAAEPEAFQAIDIVGITHGNATKVSLRPQYAAHVQEALVAAYHAAVTGRPGAVLVDMPKDVQVHTALMRPWEDLAAAFDWSVPSVAADDVLALARLIAGADRPLIYAGHGVQIGAGSHLVRDLAELCHIPVATTLHGLGTLPADHPLNLGMLGMHGTMVANLAPYLADVVIALGARFDDRVIGSLPDQFAPKARVVHVDIDARQLHRVRTVDLALHADTVDVLQQLLPLLATMPQADRGPWHASLNAIRDAMPIQSYDVPESQALSHEAVYAMATQALDSAAHKDVVATFDVGTHQMKGAQWFQATRPRTWISSGGMGSMGCSLPMAVGAHFAVPQATILAFCGDGGFVMSSHEMDTIGAYELPIKIVVFDDSSLGMVSNWHGLYFEGRRLTSDRRRGRRARNLNLGDMKARLRGGIEEAASVDDLVSVLGRECAGIAQSEWPLFTALAASYGIPAERVHTKEQFLPAFHHALAAPGPYLLQVMLPAAHGVFPLMEPGTTPQDIVWRESAPGSGHLEHARDHFDYAANRLRSHETAEDTLPENAADVDLSAM